jgi:hypothetical protein
MLQAISSKDIEEQEAMANIVTGEKSGSNKTGTFDGLSPKENLDEVERIGETE